MGNNDVICGCCSVSSFQIMKKTGNDPVATWEALSEAEIQRRFTDIPLETVIDIVLAGEGVDGLSVVDVQSPKTFDGTPEQAMSSGWVDGEFGWVCPDCSGEFAEDPEVEHGIMTPDNPVARILAEQVSRLDAGTVAELRRRTLDALGGLAAGTDDIRILRSLSAAHRAVVGVFDSAAEESKR